MTAAMSPDAVAELGFWFALSPIAVGTAFLVMVATGYARITGRHYPFRQFDDASRHGTEDRDPEERLGLSEDELTGILERYSQSFNIGVEDLARLIGAAELQVAAQSTGPLSAQDIMSRNLVTVRQDTDIGTIAELFTRHKFTSLPVVDSDDRFLGVIFQMDLIVQTRSDATRLKRGYWPALKRLLDREREAPTRAGDIMRVACPRATTETPIGVLLHMVADGDTDAVPIIEYGKPVGIVTRTDMLAAMARRVVHAGAVG
ncbi:CBS-domain protein-containing membrane protein [Salipiger mucosus DSM 16094]|uniref:CBS-domain protein-containing membrane protein n=2 Tax=Salipiger mucosus TaxID=263378 RepID=S9QQR2_9RHOB|nr:CBS-domain protein-containing membrane protein [Salipiger mucosus DSM 16094]